MVFTSGTPRDELADLAVTVDYTVAGQWWIGQRVRGALTTKMSRVMHLWSDSPDVLLRFDDRTVQRQINFPGAPDYPETVRTARIIGRSDYRRGRDLAKEESTRAASDSDRRPQRG